MRGVRMYKPGYATVGNFLEPRITSEDEVKIRVHYCAINSDDYSMYMGKLKSRYASYGLLNEFVKTRMQLRRSAREIKLGNLKMLLKDFKALHNAF